MSLRVQHRLERMDQKRQDVAFGSGDVKKKIRLSKVKQVQGPVHLYSPDSCSAHDCVHSPLGGVHGEEFDYIHVPQPSLYMVCKSVVLESSSDSASSSAFDFSATTC